MAKTEQKDKQRSIIGSSKFNYHTITTTAPPALMYVLSSGRFVYVIKGSHRKYNRSQIYICAIAY
jgi:hypothetical protein